MGRYEHVSRRSDSHSRHSSARHRSSKRHQRSESYSRSPSSSRENGRRSKERRRRRQRSRSESDERRRRRRSRSRSPVRSDSERRSPSRSASHKRRREKANSASHERRSPASSRSREKRVGQAPEKAVQVPHTAAAANVQGVDGQTGAPENVLTDAKTRQPQDAAVQNSAAANAAQNATKASQESPAETLEREVTAPTDVKERQPQAVAVVNSGALNGAQNEAEASQDHSLQFLEEHVSVSTEERQKEQKAQETAVLNSDAANGLQKEVKTSQGDADRNVVATTATAATTESGVNSDAPLQVESRTKAGSVGSDAPVTPQRPVEAPATHLAEEPVLRPVDNFVLETPGQAARRPRSKPARAVGGFFGGNDDDEQDSDSYNASRQMRRRRVPFVKLDDPQPLAAAAVTLLAGQPRNAAAAVERDSANGPAEEEDPLETFMTGIEGEVKKQQESEAGVSGGGADVTGGAAGGGADAAMVMDEDGGGGDDDVGGDVRQGRRQTGSDEGSDDEDFMRNAAEAEEDEEESWLTKIRKKRLVYEKIDHSKIKYEPFKKTFYIEPAEAARQSAEELMQLRRSLGGIRIRGKNCPRPVRTWGQCGLPSKVLEVLRRLNYERPTPIQAQSIPCVMGGRDMIGVASTGSGKTLAFVLPMVRHVAAQRPVQPGEGPIALIIAPTRELAIQIYGEARRFCRSLNLNCVCAYGGAGVGEQISELKRGAEIVVCTPGRMIDLLAMNQGRITNLRRTTFVVLDEADRMFDMGFEPQVTRVVENVRSDRQTVMFSATFPAQVETLARKILRAPVEIVVGGNSVAAASIEQHVEVIAEDAKLVRVLDIIAQWRMKGAILIFVERQDTADRVFRDLARGGYRSLALHGGMDQADRDSAIADFKGGNVDILVATSVAARGLDVKHLRVVINYDVPNHYEDYVHRVGRTGRAGNTGTAYTFIAPEQEMYAGELVKALRLSARRALEDANPGVKREELGLKEVEDAAVPQELKALAEEFDRKRKAGEVKHGAGSGYGGKGFKFTQDEDEVNKAVRRLQAQEYGVEVKSTGKEGSGKLGASAASNAADDDDDVVIRDVESDDRGGAGRGSARDRRGGGGGGAAARGGAALPVFTSQHGQLVSGAPPVNAARASDGATAPHPAPPVHNRQDERLSSYNSEQVRGEIDRVSEAVAADAKRQGKSEIETKAMMAREIAGLLAGLKSTQPRSAQAPATPSALPLAGMLRGAPVAGSGVESAERSAAVAAAAEINQRLAGAAGGAATAQAAAAAPGGGGAELDDSERVMRKYTELEINDYPQHARWKVTHKNALADIEEFTNTAVTTKGLYYAPGRNPPAGERKLYLLIEGPDEISVRNSRREIKSRMDEAAMARPDDKPQYSKYTVM